MMASRSSSGGMCVTVPRVVASRGSSPCRMRASPKSPTCGGAGPGGGLSAKGAGPAARVDFVWRWPRAMPYICGHAASERNLRSLGSSATAFPHHATPNPGRRLRYAHVLPTPPQLHDPPAKAAHRPPTATHQGGEPPGVLGGAGKEDVVAGEVAMKHAIGVQQ